MLLVNNLASGPSYLPRGALDVPWLIQLSESIVVDATSARAQFEKHYAYGYSTVGATPKGTWEMPFKRGLKGSRLLG